MKKWGEIRNRPKTIKSVEALRLDVITYKKNEVR